MGNFMRGKAEASRNCVTIPPLHSRGCRLSLWHTPQIYSAQNYVSAGGCFEFFLYPLFSRRHLSPIHRANFYIPRWACSSLRVHQNTKYTRRYHKLIDNPTTSSITQSRTWLDPSPCSFEFGWHPAGCNHPGPFPAHRALVRKLISPKFVY